MLVLQIILTFKKPQHFVNVTQGSPVVIRKDLCADSNECADTTDKPSSKTTKNINNTTRLENLQTEQRQRQRKNTKQIEPIQLQQGCERITEATVYDTFYIDQTVSVVLSIT